MFIPGTYSVALLLLILSMLCWGSWANTQKITRQWPFQLYYFDYTLGFLICSIIFGLTLGQTHPSSPESFFLNLRAASERSLLEAFAGGAIFSVGNMLIVGAISVAGMAVAFPIGAGLALILGAVLNYIVSPAGNPMLIFPGIGLVCIAIVLDALAYRDLSHAGATTRKGILLSVVGGIGAGLFYPLLAKSQLGPGHLQPYTVNFVFSLGAAASALPLGYLLIRKPMTGRPLRFRDYRSGSWSVHAWGIAGGLIWGVGTIANFVASYLPMIGRSTSFSMAQGNTMISTLWGLLVWKEFRGASVSGCTSPSCFFFSCLG
ncbi:MAG: GRP family sugar transporter [Candidatus Acidiferrales bacterium]